MIAVNPINKTIYHGIADANEIISEFSYFHAATSKYVKFTVYPKKKRKNKEAAIEIKYNASASRLAYSSDSFAEWLNELRYYYEDIKEVTLSMHWKLLDSNIEKCLSFLMHAKDLEAIEGYAIRVLGSYTSSGKSEIYIKIDLENEKLILDRNFEVKIFKVKFCEE
ncbi:MAG: hypothetical protein JHC31_13315 [Sulfurihydrogenibium sp.]|jgi:hypothetical protein|nr:hypothetical protein [Sulfurihydrogenibium sp.]